MLKAAWPARIRSLHPNRQFFFHLEIQGRKSLKHEASESNPETGLLKLSPMLIHSIHPAFDNDDKGRGYNNGPSRPKPGSTAEHGLSHEKNSRFQPKPFSSFFLPTGAAWKQVPSPRSREAGNTRLHIRRQSPTGPVREEGRAHVTILSGANMLRLLGHATVEWRKCFLRLLLRERLPSRLWWSPLPADKNRSDPGDARSPSLPPCTETGGALLAPAPAQKEITTSLP